MPDLYDPLTIGAWTLPHRIVLAPMTRNRADAYGVHGDLGVDYYGQRAVSGGLLIAEGTQPSLVGQGYCRTAGIHSAEQVAGWRRVADAVHERDGRIVVQLMHVGRIAHPDNKHGAETVAPSAIAAPDQMFTEAGMRDYPVPRALGLDEIPSVVEEYVQAARNAVEAGVDGVEVHAANGYLVHQFLSPTTNQRTDEYGGSPAARARFAVEVTRAVVEAIGADRVGIRFSPGHGFNGCTEDDPADAEATYAAVMAGIAPLGLAYVSLLAVEPDSPAVDRIRADFTGPVIFNTGFNDVTTREGAQALLDQGLGEAVAVGRLFLANPDLPHRWRTGAELNEPDPDSFYTPGAHGYTDYPFLNA